MKTREKVNPLDGKSENPNIEPWLTPWEIVYEESAIQNGIHRMMEELLNG